MSAAQHCNTCDAVGACRRAFGKYWEAKSGGGIGCGFKFPAKTAEQSSSVNTSGSAAGTPSVSKKGAKKFWQEEML